MDQMIVERPGIGRICLAWRDDWPKRQTYYTVKALRVSGTITVAAETDAQADDPLNPDACRIRLGYGVAAGTRYEFDRQLAERPDRLTVNGVRLAGDNYVWPSELRARPMREWVNPRWAPDKTQARAAAVLTAVAGHWITRDPTYLVFCLATVAAAASGHAAELSRTAQRARQRLTDASTELTAARAGLIAAADWYDLPAPAATDTATTTTAA